MPLSFYLDHHVPRAVAIGLRHRGVEVLTASEDGCEQLEDRALLERSTELERVLFTQDDDFLVLANAWRQDGKHFAGVVFGHQLRVSIGQCVADLELIAKVGEQEDIKSTVLFLPL